MALATALHTNIVKVSSNLKKKMCHSDMPIGTNFVS